MDGFKEAPLGHDFHVTADVEVEPAVIDATKKAISMVWDKHIGEPTSFNVIFASRLLYPKTGEDTGWSCEYDPDSDTFKFAMETIAERMNMGLDEEARMTILAAHEATHKVQFKRGDPPRPSPKTHDMDEYYNNDRHEEEAWNEGLHVFKKIYPNSSGGFTTGNRRYEIPSESKY